MTKIYDDLPVVTERELRMLARTINEEARLRTYFLRNQKRDLIDEKVLIQKFRAMKKRERIKAFRKQHECTLCYYYQEGKCRGIDRCIMEDGEDEHCKDSKKHDSQKCPLDPDGTCPYGRPEGICVGPCYRNIIQDFRGGNGNREKRKEESQNGTD